MTFKKTSSMILIAALTAATAFHFVVKARNNDDSSLQRTPVAVEVLKISLQESYKEWRSFTGRVTAGRTSPLGFELGGTLQHVWVDIGSRVKKGDKLAQLDTARLQANLQRLKAETTSAKAGLKLAESTLKRTKETYAKGHMSAQHLDEAEARRNQAAAQLLTLDASISALSVDMNRSTILAPFNGVITERLADDGRIMAAGTPIFTLVETSALEAHIGVAPQVAASLEKGMPYRLIDYTRKDISGMAIRTIVPVIEGQTRTRMVILTLQDGTARDGDLMTILVQDHKQAIGAWVPLRALSADVRGLWRVNKITKGKGGATHVGFENVQILYTTGQRAFVSGTISDGDQIVTGGVSRLAHNERVRVVKERSSVLPEIKSAAKK